jgi:hypothetical protein
MNEDKIPEESVVEEFRNLGKNLFGALQAALEKPEFKKVQQDVVDGISDLGSTLKREGKNLTEGSTGQQIKANIDELGQRLRNVEVQNKIRLEVLSVLKSANAELEKVISRWSPTTEPGQAPPHETPADQPQSAEPPAAVQTEDNLGQETDQPG